MSTSEMQVQQTSASVPDGAKTTKKAEKKSTTAKQAKPSHPPTSDMVNNAIEGLKEKSGSSLQAIKKFIGSNYKVDPEKLAPFIRKYLKSAVLAGSLVQTKGKGASGSFKLAAVGSQSKPQRKLTRKTIKSAESAVKNSTSVLTATQKKRRNTPVAKTPIAVNKSKKTAATQKKSPKVSKSPSKAKKNAKLPMKKPKAPKPKTVKSVAAPKKTAPAKKKK